MARFVPLQDQGAQPEFKPAQPTAQPRFVPLQQAAPPGPLTAQQAGQRSQAIAPGQQAARADALIESRREVSPRARLESRGVGFQEAPFGAQFDYGLGAPLAQTPEQKMALASAALNLPRERIGYDADTEQVLYQPEGSDQFQTFNVPGPSRGDITRFIPEAGVLAGGVTGGLVGGGVGTGLANPLAVAGGAVVGEATGEGLGQAARIMAAASRDLVDPTPNEIIQASMNRAGEAAVGAGIGAAGGAVFRSLLAKRLGVDADVLDALGNRPLSEITQQNDAVARRVQRATGQEFPTTLGQRTGSQEVLRAEEAGSRLREVNAPLRDIAERQRPALKTLEQRTLGGGVDPSARTEVGRAALEAGERRVSAAEAGLETATHRAFGRGVPPEQGVTGVRSKIEAGREQVFAPLKKQFDDLQSEVGFDIDLDPVRREAMRLSSEEGQDILRSVSIHAQSPLLREAKGAGLETIEVEPGVFQEVARPVSLGEVQRALRDIRAELRRPGMVDEKGPRKRILERMRDKLIEARDASIPATDRARIHMLEEEYATAMNQLERQVVGEFMDVDPVTRVPKLQGAQAVQRLLRNPADTAQFIEALDSIPTGAAAKVRVRDSVMGYLRETYQNPDTGDIDPARLRTFLRNRNNREALSVLFSGRPQVLKNLDNAQKAAEQLNRLHRQMETARGRMDKALGIPTADPAELATKFMNEADARGLKVARRLLPPDRRPQFDQVLRASFRDQMVDKQGAVDAGKIEAFLNGNRANVAREMFGRQYLEDLELLKDATRLTQQRAERGAAGDLAQYFSRDINALQGLMRFTRVPFAPLSVQGRAFTASLGVFQDRARRRLADIIANPDDLRELAKLAKVSPGTRRAEIILTRLGLDAYEEAERLSNEQSSQQAPPER